MQGTILQLLVTFCWCCYYAAKNKFNVAFSSLTLLVGRQEGHPTCKNWVVRYWCGYLSWKKDRPL